MIVTDVTDVDTWHVDTWLMARMAPFSDADLVGAAPHSKEAFVELQRRYSKFILRTARVLGFGDDAEDVEQDVWLLLLRGRWRLADAGHHADLRAFLHTLLSRLRARHARKRARLAGSVDVNPETLDDMVHGRRFIHRIEESPVVVELIASEQLHSLRAAVRTLSPHDRTLLRLRYDGDGKTLAEMAQSDGRTASALHLHLTRIHKLLAAQCGVEFQRGLPGHFRKTAGVTRRVWTRRVKRAREGRAA